MQKSHILEVCCGICIGMLWYAVVCCSMLWYAVVCCSMLWYAVVCAGMCFKVSPTFEPIRSLFREEIMKFSLCFDLRTQSVLKLAEVK